MIPAAVAAARAADIVVLAVGTDLSWSREGHDAETIVFNPGQVELINQVAAAAKQPVIVVLFTATPLDLTDVLSNPKIGAVLHVGQPAVQTLGIGDLLFGKRVPAGRMIQTVLPASYAAEISIFDFNMRPGPSVWPRPDCTKQPPSECPLGTNPGRTYRFYTGDAVVPFGFGLSYTTFSYRLAQSPQAPISLDQLRNLLKETHAAGRTFLPLASAQAPLVEYRVSVTNTGNYDADDVVLGFIVPPGAGTNGAPLKYLFGFERIHVPKGKTVTVILYPALGDFSQVNEHGERYPLVGEYEVHFGSIESKEFGQGFVLHKLTVV